MNTNLLTPVTVAIQMEANQAALRSKLGSAGTYERRDAPSIKDAIEKINTAFEEFKKTNDARIEAIQKGLGTAELDAKLAKIEQTIDGLSEMKTQLEKLQTQLARPGIDAQQKSGESVESAQYRSAFVSWMRNPADPELRTALQQRARELKKAQTQTQGDDDWDTRSVQTVTSAGAAGGFAVPEVIERQIERLTLDISPIRQIATVRTVGSSDYKELFDIGGAGFGWVGETDARAKTNTPDLAEVAPTFGMAAAYPYASEESLDDLFFDVENWLISSASEAIAYGEGKSFVQGTGLKQPTGFLTGPVPLSTPDATRAFGTLQYVASGSLTAAQVAAGVIVSSNDLLYDLVYGLRARYRSNARWVCNRIVVSALRKIKDTTGQYLWQSALAAGQPATFMGYPITEAEDMPAIVLNAFPLAFGDFKSGYLIADRVGMRITRDDVTTPGFVKYYVRKRVGGKLRNTEAIKLLKIAAA